MTYSICKVALLNQFAYNLKPRMGSPSETLRYEIKEGVQLNDSVHWHGRRFFFVSTVNNLTKAVASIALTAIHILANVLNFSYPLNFSVRRSSLISLIHLSSTLYALVGTIFPITCFNSLSPCFQEIDQKEAIMGKSLIRYLNVPTVQKIVEDRACEDHSSFLAVLLDFLFKTKASAIMRDLKKGFPELNKLQFIDKEILKDLIELCSNGGLNEIFIKIDPAFRDNYKKLRSVKGEQILESVKKNFALTLETIPGNQVSGEARGVLSNVFSLFVDRNSIAPEGIKTLEVFKQQFSNETLIEDCSENEEAVTTYIASLMQTKSPRACEGREMSIAELQALLELVSAENRPKVFQAALLATEELVFNSFLSGEKREEVKVTDIIAGFFGDFYVTEKS
ncbi:hypothetical protein AB751O23_AA_00600 [Chlamydiales bacterium SCGC AB-751-O23]|nr:hypothetical protein AB751O23_AA_00600 [Chlamydiales bacterium SCGC AB-751-O23]